MFPTDRAGGVVSMLGEVGPPVGLLSLALALTSASVAAASSTTTATALTPTPRFASVAELLDSCDDGLGCNLHRITCIGNESLIHGLLDRLCQRSL